MWYFIILVSGFGLFLLYLLSLAYKDAGAMNNQLEIEREKEKQLQESKEHNKKSDEELLEWLEKQKKKEGK